MDRAELATALPGDLVKVVDRWRTDTNSRHNHSGHMDKWLGKIMTVDFVRSDGAVRCIEDNGEWVWYPELLDCFALDFTEFPEPAADDFLPFSELFSE